METTCQQGAKQTDDRSVDILWWAADAWRHDQGEALRSSDLKMYLDNKVTLVMSVVMLNTKYQCQHFFTNYVSLFLTTSRKINVTIKILKFKNAS